MAEHRRCRAYGCGGLSDGDRPAEGHDHHRWGKRLSGRSGEGVVRPARRGGCRRLLTARPEMGERVVAAIVPMSGTRFDPDAMHALCRQQIAHYKCPTRIFEVSALRATRPAKCCGRTCATHLSRTIPESDLNDRACRRQPVHRRRPVHVPRERFPLSRCERAAGKGSTMECRQGG
jgi:hypothetical protein